MNGLNIVTAYTTCCYYANTKKNIVNKDNDWDVALVSLRLTLRDVYASERAHLCSVCDYGRRSARCHTVQGVEMSYVMHTMLIWVCVDII